jgi:hypothetical protein
VQQAGESTINGMTRASLWTGTAASWVDLSPAGSVYSRAFGVYGGQQVGHADFLVDSPPNVFPVAQSRAGVWSGTASSWVSLHPADAALSIAWGTSGNQQVGHAAINGNDHAGLWSGTAASWVDLHPAGATRSVAFATSGTQQVGYAIVNGVTRPSLWSGTADSWVDLSSFLTGSWGSDTIAQSIWTDGSTVYIAGYGFNNLTQRREALLWTQVIPAPSAVALLGLGGPVVLQRRRR